ncbi:hypothetical protein F0562_003875 [Nyssa sinensis]|uniref:Uncharacterized protein n=1 Tax=Nyssa sinensis TaxID=561372 RepID=A0A5J5C1F3_9ASTE|nr:hypothetical protein F0562_003875 [Nyssa sinensis]
MDLRKHVFSSFQPLRKKRAIVGEPITVVLPKKMAIREDLRSKISIVETAASEAEARHRSKIEVAKVVVVDEQKDKILKLGRELTFDGCNFCFKKTAKVFSDIDTEVLDHIEVSDVESEDFKDDEVSKDPAAPTDP